MKDIESVLYSDNELISAEEDTTVNENDGLMSAEVDTTVNENDGLMSAEVDTTVNENDVSAAIDQLMNQLLSGDGSDDFMLSTISGSAPVVTEMAYPVNAMDTFFNHDLVTLAPAAFTSSQLQNPAEIGDVTAVDSFTSETSCYGPVEEAMDEITSLASPASPQLVNPYGEFESENINFSVSSPNGADDILTIISSNDSDDMLTLIVDPSEVCGEPKRKRGRRPKSETGVYVQPPRSRKTKKRKIYEIDQPLIDAEQERKRLNAINAKKHRDEQKQKKQKLEHELNTVKTERDHLKEEVQALGQREAKLQTQLEEFKRQLSSMMTVFQK